MCSKSSFKLQGLRKNTLQLKIDYQVDSAKKVGETLL